jgi:PTH1 family peptidyl-tRNA hydrolase
MNAVTQIVRRKLIKPKKASLTRPYSTPSKKPYLLVGLGNPGSEYQHTRHNIGFLAIEHIAKEHNIKLSRNKFNSVYGEGQIKGHPVILVEPMTFMNLSGTAVKQFVDYFKLDLDRCIVVFDNIHLPLGDIRMRPKGSSGGQNGVKHIIEQLKTEQFPRIAMGVGPVPKVRIRE